MQNSDSPNQEIRPTTNALADLFVESMNNTSITKHIRIPEPVTWLRAVVSAIPYVGGPFDHLLFDKANAIRLKNIEATIAALSDQIARTNEEALDKHWFDTEEAVAAFKILSDKVSYEPDKAKVDALGRVVGTFGTKKNSGDPAKLSVIEHLSKLSSVQIHLLASVAVTPIQKKDFSTGGLRQSVTAVWLIDIADTLRKDTSFWSGELNLVQEFEVLEAFNVVRRVQLFGHTEIGYVLSSLGKRAASYVREAGL